MHETADYAIGSNPSYALIAHLLANVGHFAAYLEHGPLDAAPDRKITARRTPRR